MRVEHSGSACRAFGGGQGNGRSPDLLGLHLAEVVGVGAGLPVVRGDGLRGATVLSSLWLYTSGIVYSYQEGSHHGGALWHAVATITAGTRLDGLPRRKEAGLTSQALYKLERQATLGKVRGVTLKKLAQLYQVTMDYLVYDVAESDDDDAQAA